jgi:hypothetical protein
MSIIARRFIDFRGRAYDLEKAEDVLALLLYFTDGVYDTSFTEDEVLALGAIRDYAKK